MAVTGFNDSMNLFVQGPPTISTDSNVDLTITGSSEGALYEFKTLSLFINGEPWTAGLNFFLGGSPNLVRQNSGLNMHIMGGGTYFTNFVNFSIFGSVVNQLNYVNLTVDQFASLSLDDYVALLLWSEATFGFPTYKGLNLYISGEGLVPDANVGRSYLNLYIAAKPGAYGTLSLFMNASPVPNNAVALSLSGILGKMSNGVNMTLDSTGQSMRILKLFARGYNA